MPSATEKTYEAILCRAVIEMPERTASSIMWMPGGLHEITPFAGGTGVPIQVLVDAESAAMAERQRARLEASGRRPYFDFEHEDRGASFWPAKFYWKESPKPGIYASGNWTDEGRAGVDGKKWRLFSPVFFVDDKSGKPARLVCNAEATPNMGGLVNSAAFREILPLWAKNATGAQSGNSTNTYMTPEEVKALQDKIAALEAEIATLKSKETTDEVSAAKVECREAQLLLAQSKLQVHELQAKNAQADAEIQTQRAAAADAAVQAAIERGAIAAKDEATIAAWKKDITETPERAALLAKMGGTPVMAQERLTGLQPAKLASARVTGVAAKDAVAAYGALLAKNKEIVLSPATAAEKDKLANEAASIFAADLGKLSASDLSGAIMAADTASDSLGVLTGALALQSALPELLRTNPLLSLVSSDFSAEPGIYNQTTNTRVILRPAVQTYDGSNGADGRPKGWTLASEARTVDVPVQINQYFSVPIVFGVTTLASTGRNLFSEQAPQAINAMGSYLTDQLTALFTAGNYNGCSAVRRVSESPENPIFYASDGGLAVFS